MDKQGKSNSVEYARRVYDSTIGWYNNADTKAEIILTLDGIFLAFVTGSLFIKKTDLQEIIQAFTWVTWLFMLFMAICLVGSIVTAIICLWSRISISNTSKKKYFSNHQIKVDEIETYVPQSTYFFQSISWLNPALYPKYLQTVDENFELIALTTNVHTLSTHVLQKHRYVDWSFALAGGSLISFFAMGISYILIL